MAGELLLWIVLLFAIVGTVCVLFGKFIHNDTWEYDQTFVWRRKIPQETQPQEIDDEQNQ